MTSLGCQYVEFPNAAGSIAGSVTGLYVTLLETTVKVGQGNAYDQNHAKFNVIHAHARLFLYNSDQQQLGRCRREVQLLQLRQ
jgi:hypothetical protein